MLAIIQKCNNTDKIVGFISNNIEFNSSLDNYISRIYGKDYQNLENVSKDDLKNSKNYGENIYLLKYSDKIELVKKYYQLNEGYIYNTKTCKLAHLYTWYLMPIDIKIESNLHLIEKGKETLDIHDNNTKNLFTSNLNNTIISKLNNKFVTNNSDDKTTEDIELNHNTNYDSQISDSNSDISEELRLKEYEKCSPNTLYNINKHSEKNNFLILGNNTNDNIDIVKYIFKNMNVKINSYNVILISPDGMNSKYKDFIASSKKNVNISRKINDKFLGSILRQQCENIEKKNEAIKYIIFDNCIKDEHNSNETLLEILVNGLHYNIHYIVIMDPYDNIIINGINYVDIFITSKVSLYEDELSESEESEEPSEKDITDTDEDKLSESDDTDESENLILSVKAKNFLKNVLNYMTNVRDINHLIWYIMRCQKNQSWLVNVNNNNKSHHFYYYKSNYF